MTARPTLPQTEGSLFLAYVGMETDLIFNQGMDLPGFASFPLVETKDGRALLKSYFDDIIQVARSAGMGVVLESPTWVANRDRARNIGYAIETVMALNEQALEIMSKTREENADVPIILSLNLGPRSDAYAPSKQMTADAAEVYHKEQIAAVAGGPLDLVSGYTLAYPEEAIGIVRAARSFGLEVVIAFTVETNGSLPTVMTLADAIAQVDAETDSAAAYFMINCAHPDHFNDTLKDAPFMHRLKGIIANASRCSHAELDEAEELDAGNPKELGKQLAALRHAHPGITVLGGCCGTDMRHMTEIAKASKSI